MSWLIDLDNPALLVIWLMVGPILASFACAIGVLIDSFAAYLRRRRCACNV